MGERNRGFSFRTLMEFPWWIMTVGGILLAVWVGFRMCSCRQEIEIIASPEESEPKISM